MNIKVRNISFEVKIALSLIIISLVLVFLSHKSFVQIITENMDIITRIFILTIAAVVISTIVHILVPTDFFRGYLKQNKFIYFLIAAILGILTPGPVYAIYPVVVLLKKEGIDNAILVSYLSGQTIVGPARIPFEIGLFGMHFFIYRVILSIVMAVSAGLLYAALSKVFPDPN